MSQDIQGIAARLRTRLDELSVRAEEIEALLRAALDPDSEERAVELADDEALAGVDVTLRNEMTAVERAIVRLECGEYGRCVTCGEPIAEARLLALPTADKCLDCASAATGHAIGQ